MGATGGSSPIRLGGLTSGFDTDTIISQLLAREQAKIDEITEEVEINKAKISTWEDIAEQLKSLADVVNTLKSDGSGSNTLFDDKAIASSDATVANATASSSAIAAEYSVSVTTMARAMVAYGSQKASNYVLPSGGTVTLNGAAIALSAGDSLETIANKINGATYLTGEELTATVIDERLVLQTKNQGAASTIYGTAAGSPPFTIPGDDANDILRTELGIVNDPAGTLVNTAQTSADASFSINGIPLTRTSNTVTDAISGVTLNLEKTGSATLSVTHNTENIKNTIREFVDLYNETRDFIDRTRNAKLDENDQFGLFFSDSLMRELFDNVRSLTTSGVKMGGADWDGTPLTQGAASIGAKQLTIDGFTAATGTLNEGDQIVLTGDSTIYTLTADATISGNQATINIQPPLVAAASDNSSVTLAIRTLEDAGVGVRTDTVSGVDGIIGILDEGELDKILSNDVGLLKKIFTRNGSTDETTGVARRLHDWIDKQTKITVFQSTTRGIDSIKIPGLEDSNEQLEEQIERLQVRMAQREEVLIRQFSEMEAALARSQSQGSALAGALGQQPQQ